MNPAPHQNPNPPDPLGAYIEGARDVVDAARPDEPTSDQWDAVGRAIYARLSNAPAPARSGSRWRVVVLAAGGAVAAAVAWVPVAVKNDVAESRPFGPPPVSEAPADPLAEFAVLPMASAGDVDLRRVPGSGVIPVGADPLPEVLILATPGEVELDDPGSAWPAVTPSPGDAPMIFAAKPR